jgi:hypothetical protein
MEIIMLICVATSEILPRIACLLAVSYYRALVPYRLLGLSHSKISSSIHATISAKSAPFREQPIFSRRQTVGRDNRSIVYSRPSDCFHIQSFTLLIRLLPH